MRHGGALRGAIAAPGDVTDERDRASQAGAGAGLAKDDGTWLDLIGAGEYADLDGVGGDGWDFIKGGAEGGHSPVDFAAGLNSASVHALNVTPGPALAGDAVELGSNQLIQGDVTQAGAVKKFDDRG